MRDGSIFERFKQFITNKLVNEWTKFDKRKAKLLLTPIYNILASPEEFKINVFSLNYDLIFEQMFNTPQARILDNGFSEKTISEQKVRFWSADFNDPLSPTKINLYKLHGSLDWEYNQESEEIIIKEKVNDGKEPLIIFGSYSKMLSFDPFLFILSEFRQLLGQAALFVVVGYSFHDKYINNLLIQQLSLNSNDNTPKKMLIVDPKCKGMSERQFVEELKSIQDSKSINDIINFKHINPERVKLIPQKTKEFYKDIFADNAKMLINLIDELEQSNKVF